MQRLPSPDAHWRDSARPAMLWLIDARSTFPLLLFLTHIRIWTFVVALSVIVFFSVLNHYGFNFQVFSRWIRALLAGKRKLSNPWWI